MPWTPELRTTASGEPRWRVRVRHGGHQQAKVFATVEGADAFVELLEQLGVEQALYVLEVRSRAPRDAATTVRSWCLEYIAAKSGITEGTRTDYRRYAERDLGVLAELPLAAVDDTLVAQWVNGLETAGQGAKTIANKHGFLWGAFERARLKGHVPANPCTGTRLPRSETEPMVFLTHEEYARFRRYFTPKWQPFVDVLVATGLRFGEITALQVRDVDLNRSKLTVSRAWKESAGDGSGRQLGAPKTKKSERTIALAPETVAALKPLVDGKARTDFVFLNARDDVVKPQTFHDNVWAPAVRLANGEPGQRPGPKAKRVARRLDEHGNVIEPASAEEALGKRPRVHDARHTCASWLLGAGVPISYVQAHLGHESITTTVDRYGHLLPGAGEAIARALSAALTGSSSASAAD